MCAHLKPRTSGALQAAKRRENVAQGAQALRIEECLESPGGAKDAPHLQIVLRPRVNLLQRLVQIFQ
jgi:hypothetical protein